MSTMLLIRSPVAQEALLPLEARQRMEVNILEVRKLPLSILVLSTRQYQQLFHSISNVYMMCRMLLLAYLNRHSRFGLRMFLPA